MKHRIFISWSGEPSKAVAEALRDWLPLVVQSVAAWLSAQDISPGLRWNNAIAERLADADFGIICATRQNVERPWLLFEAGALSQSLEHSRVCPYLLALDASNLPPPLAQFEAVTADKAGTWRLIKEINAHLGEDELDPGSVVASL